MVTNTDAPEDAYVYTWEGEPGERNWLPNGACIAASEFFGRVIDQCSREERDWALRTYMTWLDLGRPRRKNGDPAPFWMIAAADDPMTRRMIALERDRRASLAAVGLAGSPETVRVEPEATPKPPAEPDAPAEAQASRWSRLVGLPRHRRDRPSQLAPAVAARKARARERKADLERGS